MPAPPDVPVLVPARVLGPVRIIADYEGDRIPSAPSDPDCVARLKQEWDPDNRLRGNHNVTPAS